MEKGDTWNVMFLLALMAFAVILVEERWLRVAIALLPTMLLAQRALEGTPAAEPMTGFAERRRDDEVRSYIDELLKHFREFYTNVHMLAKGELSPEEAAGWATQLERELNSLLAEVTDAARGDASPPSG